ncbi:MAG: trimethylamine---corrinoid protein Co-methyltransferase [Clostridia bacterium]|nr:trimethylamine---corrinoid protein Co-methyltransferase [Clostridia bacterium]
MLFSVEALTKEQLESVHEATLDLLNRYGIVMQHAPSRELLKKHGAKVEGETVKIPRNLVEDALRNVPASFSVVGRNPKNKITIGGQKIPVLGPGGGAIYAYDLEKGRRAVGLQELRDILALTQSSTDIEAVCAGNVYSKQFSAQQAMLETIRLSDKPMIGISLSKKVSEDCLEMARIATGVTGEQYLIGVFSTNSPMLWEKNMLDSLWVYAEKNQPLIIACASMAGFTSPVSLISTVVQDNAEVLAGIVMAQLINPGVPVVYGNTSTITDMLTMNLCIGAPEYALISAAAGQLARYYGIPYRSGGGLTDAKELDTQAGIEAATNLLFTFANKVDFVLQTPGVMESFLTVSYEKWIIDEEICGRIKRMFKGIGELPTDAVNKIGEVGASGHFLDKPETLKSFRSEFYQPPVSDRSNLTGWEKKNKDLQQAAYEKWKKRLEEFVAPELPQDVARELQKYV